MYVPDSTELVPNENSRKEDVALEILQDQDVTQFRSLRSGWFNWSQPCLFRSVWICLSERAPAREKKKKDLHTYNAKKLCYEEKITPWREKRKGSVKRIAFVSRLFNDVVSVASVSRDTVD